MMSVFVVGCGAFVACSASQPPEVEPDGRTEFRLPSGLADAILADAAGGPQHAALEDGIITFGEYERGVLDAVVCLKEKGLEPSQPVLDSRGVFYKFTYSVPDGRDDLFASARECMREHADAVSSAWSFVHQPTQKEFDDARAALVICLRDGGIDVPEAPSPQFFVSLATSGNERYASCANRIQDEFGIEGFAG